MKSCRHCGEKALDSDEYCPKCGYRLHDATAIPTTAKPVREVRRASIGIAAIVLCMLVIGAAFYLSMPKSSAAPTTGSTGSTTSNTAPTNYGEVGNFAVRGNRTVGFTASFYLLNKGGTIQAFGGNALFRITDGGAHILYKSSFQFAVSQYNIVNKSAVWLSPPSSGPGYQWIIPASDVSPTVAKGVGADAGIAYLYLSVSGINSSSETGGFTL